MEVQQALEVEVVVVERALAQLQAQPALVVVVVVVLEEIITQQ
jgi:hypothetical protein